MREWVVRMAMALLGIAAATMFFTSGCSTNLGTLDIKTDGAVSGLMYKNCGCGCTAVMDIDSDDSLDAGGTTPGGSETEIGVNVGIPLK
jgi:hypothetical protein